MDNILKRAITIHIQFILSTFIGNIHRLNRKQIPVPGPIPQQSPDKTRASVRELSDLLSRVNGPHGVRDQLPVQVQFANQQNFSQLCRHGG